MLSAPPVGSQMHQPHGALTTPQEFSSAQELSGAPRNVQDL